MREQEAGSRKLMITGPPYRSKSGSDKGGPPTKNVVGRWSSVVGENQGQTSKTSSSGAPQLEAYRGRTVAMLRRYFRLSLDIGRLPSVLGREFFRARVSSYHVHSFEDAVILVHDVETCLQRLDPFARTLVARIALQEYTWEETGTMLRCCRRTVGRRYHQAIDELSETFLRVGLLREMEVLTTERENSCQEGDEEEESLSWCAAS